jgi:hypothetical protein
MKLEFKYLVTVNGSAIKEVPLINDKDKASYIEDIRNLCLKYQIKGDNVAVKFVDDGAFIIVSNFIEGGMRPDDNISTWIYVDKKIKISGHELWKAIKHVKDINKSSKRTKNDFEKDEVLWKDYTEIDKSLKLPPIKSSKNREYAYRLLDGQNREEVLGNLFQEYYARYEYIFFYYGHCPSPSALENLSDNKIYRYVQLQKDILKSVLKEADIYLERNNEHIEVYKNYSSKTFKAEKNEDLKFIAKRKGFEDITLEGNVEELNPYITLNKDGLKWRKSIKIKVVDSESDQPLSDAKIRINNPSYQGREVACQEKVVIYENELNGIKVTASCKGYQTYDGTISIENISIENLTIKLVKDNNLKSKIRLSNGSTYNASIELGKENSKKEFEDGLCLRYINGKFEQFELEKEIDEAIEKAKVEWEQATSMQMTATPSPNDDKKPAEKSLGETKGGTKGETKLGRFISRLKEPFKSKKKIEKEKKEKEQATSTQMTDTPSPDDDKKSAENSSGENKGKTKGNNTRIMY